MEGLGVAASAFAVTSLAIQLAENANRLYEFWQSVREAPAAVRAIAADLKLLADVLAEVAADGERAGESGVARGVLENCSDHIAKMLAMTRKLEAGMDSSKLLVRKWSAMKAVFREEKIAKFQGLLERTKTTLILARQSLSDRRARQHYENQSQMMLSITQNMSSFQLENTQTSRVLKIDQDSSAAAQLQTVEAEVRRMASSIPNPVIRAAFQKSMVIALKQVSESTMGDVRTPRNRDGLFETQSQISHGHGSISTLPARKRILKYKSSTETSNLFGKVTFSSGTFELRPRIEEVDSEDQEDDSYEEEREIKFTMYPADWLIRLGLKYGVQLALSRSSQEWKHTLRTFNPVPFDSLIFQYCQTGNIDGVRSLLSRKEASIWDTSIYGWTPIHFAATNTQLDIYKLLVTAGADVNMRDEDDWSSLQCFTYAAASEKVSWNGISSSTLIELVRMLLATSTIEDENDDCWECLGFLARRIVPPNSEGYTTLLWLVELLKPSMEKHPSLSMPWEDLMKAAIRFDDKAIVALCLKNRPSEINDAPYITGTENWAGNYPGISICLALEAYSAAESFVQKGADLHISSFNGTFSPARETPTSITLYSSYSFYKWREILILQDIDLEAFIEKELSNASLAADYWNEQTLLKLFKLEYEPSPSPKTILSEMRCCMCTESWNRGSGNVPCHEIGEAWDRPCDPMLWVELSWQLLLDQLKGGDTPHDPVRAPSVEAVKELIESASHPPYSESAIELDHAVDETASSVLSNRADDIRFIPDGRWVCQGCWQEYHRPQRELNTQVDAGSDSDDDSKPDDDSDHDDSPFLLRI